MATSARWQAFLAVCALILLSVSLGYYVWAQSLVYIPDYGGAYVEGLAGSPIYLNPLYADFNEIDSDLCSLIFDGLTAVDAQGQVVPSLAQSWRVEEEGLAYIFELRQDVFWHDGAPFTVQDVLFTIRQIQDPDFAGPSALAEFWRDIKVEALDMFTVRFELSQPFAPFLSHTTIGLLPEHLLGGISARNLINDTFNIMPVGTGPFRVADADVEALVLERHADDFRERPYLDRVEFRFYADEESVLQAYARGEIDGISYVSPDNLPAVRADAGLNLYSAPTSGYVMAFLNLDLPIFEDELVREALLHALDRQGIIDKTAGGQGIVAHSPIPQFSWAYDPAVQSYDYNPTLAAALLEYAGWSALAEEDVRLKGPMRLEFTLTHCEREPYASIAAEMAQQWAAVGVGVALQPMAAADLVSDCLRPRQYEALLYAWPEMPTDPDLYALWHSTQATPSGQNLSGYDDDASDILLEEGRLQLDGAVRKRLYDQFQQRFADQVPALLLFQPVYNYAVSQRVQGVQLGPLWSGGDRFRGIREWYVQTRRLTPDEARLQGMP